MIKLVILSESMAGQSHELKVEKTTIGRVEDNTFPIAEPSVSSHHCEVFLRDAGVVVRDLQSTNGTYINGERITEAPLLPGQVLRLGQVELRLETDATQAAAKKTTGPTVAMQRGVSLNELESGVKSGSFDMTRKGFSKKEDKTGKIFWVAAVVVGVVILLLLVYVFSQIK
ncbi:MAG TPA: FHA domain-containing protein [Verrucomicrobiota bacterium]|mgnify:FL=1|jgi:pSer/pThr/pTyr-binding forkhead associated (FHA) protein|nr:FHA domain-containing protein [Verrucomicrobiota bacterium]OQB91646.1 MAG: FHA domain-containing protein FhaB [Verrucomicrobia bacterium ADurb.Bin118]HPY29751.1 FHA domain-containing protein [Verrucomicrobiota bacterium]HQB15530.1 FHA domain-containing protein [Verrucomicrobiota bacterium]